VNEEALAHWGLSRQKQTNLRNKTVKLAAEVIKNLTISETSSTHFITVQ
jgi:hypothetical protein